MQVRPVEGTLGPQYIAFGLELRPSTWILAFPTKSLTMRLENPTRLTRSSQNAKTSCARNR